VPRPKVGGYTHRRALGTAQRASAQAREHLQRALEAHSAQAQATLLCSCALALAQVADALAEMRALLDDARSRGQGESDAPPRAPGVTG